MKAIFIILSVLLLSSCLATKEERQRKRWEKQLNFAISKKWIDTTKRTTREEETLTGSSSGVEKEVTTNKGVVEDFTETVKTKDTLDNSTDSLIIYVQKNCPDSGKYINKIFWYRHKAKIAEEKLQSKINEVCLDDTSTVSGEDSLSWAYTKYNPTTGKRELFFGAKKRKVITTTNNYDTNIVGEFIQIPFYKDLWFYAFIGVLILLIFSFFKKR